MGKQEYLSAGRFAALVGTTKERSSIMMRLGCSYQKEEGQTATGIMRWIRWKRLM